MTRRQGVCIVRGTADDWSIGDDWSALSSKNQETSTPDSTSLFNQDLALNAAREFESTATATMSEEDIWINEIVDEIHNSFSTLNDVPLYDTAFEEGHSKAREIHSMDDMGKQISMLIRCNEHPEDLLISEGRALPPLSEEEKNDPSQLVVLTKEKSKATDFLRDSVSKIFHQHASRDEIDGMLVLDRTGVANWMTRALESENEGRVSAHDRRVLETISDYSSYGSGRLLEEDFQNLYLSTIVGDTSKLSTVSPSRHLQLRGPFIAAVWRDIRNHGILSPIEQEREQLASGIREKYGDSVASSGALDASIMDECEILDWDYRPESSKSSKSPSNLRQASGSKSSHKNLEFASDQKTPLWLRDGEFVFIDEESCIGCMQCVNVAPNSFLMLDSGRARTFHQRKAPDVAAAVASCPVDCMHAVSYRELQEFETARDQGDGRTDHKHLGHQRGHTPLHVAGIASDNNHKTSWYHTLKHKCFVSSKCPQKGCYDCPLYSKPGENPYFQKQHKEAEHVRAQHFLKHGEVDVWRKFADL